MKRFSAILCMFFSACLALAQGNVDKFHDAAAQKAAMDDYAGALKEIQKAVGLSPNSARLLFMRGMIHYMDGNRSLADADFEKVVSMPAKDADSLRVKALAYNRLRNYEARDAAFAELLNTEPKTARDFVAHAVALASMKRPGEAAGMCDSAIEKDPKFVQAYVMRGSLKNLQLKDDAGALEDFKKAVALEPSNPELLYLLGRLELESGSREDSIETLKKCLALAPESKRIQRLLRKAETGK